VDLLEKLGWFGICRWSANAVLSHYFNHTWAESLGLNINKDKTKIMKVKTNCMLASSSSFLIHVHQNIVSEVILSDRTAVGSIIGCWHDTVVSLSVWLSCDEVYCGLMIQASCLNNWIGSASRNTILQPSTPYTNPIPSDFVSRIHVGSIWRIH